MRVSLPVDPGHKTRGEVTTLRWVRRMTQVPVLKVIAYDDSQDNEIGFEWILMDFMPGVSAYRRWRKSSMAEKFWITEQIDEFQSQLFRHSLEDAKFHSMGTLCSTSNVSELAKLNLQLGRLVSESFFAGDHFEYDIPRGPFRTSHDYLSAYFSITEKESTKVLEEEADDEDTREEAEETLHLAKRLTESLPKIFPPLQNPAERTALWHDDLSLKNILIDEDAKVTAIIDWEGASCQPLWQVTDVPDFLEGGTREEEPDRDCYGNASEGGEQDEDGLDTEGKISLYWVHLMEYDQTKLRKVYIAKMKELWPLWESEATYGTLKADFFRAVLECEGWFLYRVEDWLDSVESGLFPRLADVLSQKHTD